MLTYENLCLKPAAFRSMVGLSIAEFDALYAEFVPLHQQRLAASLTKRHKQPRQRAHGAGRAHKHPLRDRLLLTLVWLRLYTTYEVLGFFFGLNKTNIEDNLHEILVSLETMAHFSFERPSKERKKLGSVEAVMDAFPDVRLVIDAKEQRIQRPNSKKRDRGESEPGSADASTEQEDKQKPYYSGKKKTHTLKNEFGVLPDGQIGAVSPSVAGGATHDLTLLRCTRLVERLDQDEAALLDKGYDGIHNDYPERRLYLPFKARRAHPLSEEQKAYNRHLSKYRIVVEHTLAQINQFQVLAQVYRHEREGHTQRVRVVAMLVNRRIQQRPLKTYPVQLSA